MPFRTIFDAGYQAFIDQERDCANLWFFVHIPKTAGSSFRAELAGLLTPNHNVQAYDGTDDDFAVRRGRAVRSFADASRETSFRFASGHIPCPVMTPILEASRSPKLLTMLRDPVSRVISDFRYQSTPQHPDHEAFRARCPSIEAYLEVAAERDKMVHFLAPHDGASVAETIRHVLDTFAFVGSTEAYDASFAMMMDLLEAERSPSLYLRRTEAGTATDVAITPELRARIARLNAGDVALYEGLMSYIREAARIRAEAPPLVRKAPERGFKAWRFV